MVCGFVPLFVPLQDGHPNDRKIVKLCEYASKNPFRIPKARPLTMHINEKIVQLYLCVHVGATNEIFVSISTLDR